MIGNIFAQEVRSTRKTMLVSVGVVLLVAALGVGTGLLRIPVLGGLGTGLGILTIVMLTPIVLGLLVENYWRTMYGREGYFTMTLPVRGRTLFAAKVLYGLVATFVSLALTALALLAVSVAFSLRNGHDALAMVRDLTHQAGSAMIWFVIAMLVVQFTYSVVTGAAMMSIGAQARFNNLGFGAPVLGYIVLYFVMQVLGLAAMLLVPLGFVMKGPDAGSLVAQGMLSDFVASFEGGLMTASPNVIGLGIVPLSIIVAALFAWWGGRSVERRTSLR